MNILLSNLALLLLILAAPAFAATTPFTLTHVLTSSHAGGRVILEYTFQLQNMTSDAFTNVDVTFAPSPPFLTHGARLRVASLAPYEAVEFPMIFVALRSEDPDELAHKPLFFATRASDGDGRAIQYPVVSHYRNP